MLRHAVDLAEAFCRRLDGVDEPVIHLETGRQGGNQHVLSYRLRIEVKRNHRGGNQCGPRMAEPFAVDLHTVIVIQAVYHGGVRERGRQWAETGLTEDATVTVSAK
ncbi:Uncharacterised protein [Klebsiella variicola]|uniref:Uncharacterized protein n=1 Tax=Klebsiella variicola TaxID=244366 RepID=A0A7H4MIQ5_KLEVA|nr:Uncharacterised protein [Klebsiella variicola]